jgi:hypothetical protein
MLWFMAMGGAVLLLVLQFSAPVETAKIVLENPSGIRCTIDPAIGRWISLEYHGKELFWTPPAGSPMLTDPGWKNYGGDKAWNSPQSDWGWPPDPQLDGEPYRVVGRGLRSVTIESKKSQKFGVRIRRTFQIDGQEPQVHVRNTLINDSGKTVRHGVWQVTQIREPNWVLLRKHKTEKQPQGWHPYDVKPGAIPLHRDQGDFLLLRRNPVQDGKYGSGHPSGRLDARIGQVLFSMDATFEPGAEYPDQGSMQQVYFGKDPLDYVELELASPIRTLRPKQRFDFDVRIRLRSVTAK